jgi:arylsulfatase A-like enzyme
MEFFEHDTWGQGNSVRGDFSARIPLVIVDPRIKGGTICSNVVRSIDLAPTLLELSGIACLSNADGVSLVPYIKGETRDMDLAAFNETGIWLTDMPGMPTAHLRYPNLLELLEVPDRRTGTLAIKHEQRSAVIAAKDRMVRLGRWKLVYQPTTHGALFTLYDLVSDPECRRDVAAEHPAVVHALRERLTAWIAGAETSARLAAQAAMAAAS